MPLNVLQSLDAPSVSFDSAEEDLRDEIQSIVSGLLGLVRVEADPLQSPPAVFLANLIERAWRAGKGFDLEGLIGAIADPPFDKIGALPLETAFPRKERQGLMMALNNLLASPSFEAWRRGEPLDVARMLRAPDGRPRLSIVSTAHLADEERLFVTALLLDKVKTWMRRQGGTSELRALVYMDEIFGYFPPHPANPPTKRPLLTLLKQARAQGVGVVLATQNPVDLDYKGLANMGTWMVGTLQTEQDRDRLSSGLQGAGLESGAVDEAPRGHEEARLPPARRAPQGSRPPPVALGHVLPARAAHSRGDLAPHEGEACRDGRPRGAEGGDRHPPARPSCPRPSATSTSPGGRDRSPPPTCSSSTPCATRTSKSRSVSGPGPSVARRQPTLSRRSPSRWTRRPSSRMRPAGLRYLDLPGWLAASGAKGIEKALRDRLDDQLGATVFRDPVTKAASKPGETREAFAARIGGGGDAADKLRQKLDKKRADLAVREQEVAGRKQEKWLAIGSAVLSNIGLLTGRKRTVSGVGSVLSKNRMEGTAEARLEALRSEVAELERQLAEATLVDPARFVEESIAPVRGGVGLLRYDLVWVY